MLLLFGFLIKHYFIRWYNHLQKVLLIFFYIQPSFLCFLVYTFHTSLSANWPKWVWFTNYFSIRVPFQTYSRGGLFCKHFAITVSESIPRGTAFTCILPLELAEQTTWHFASRGCETGTSCGFACFQLFQVVVHVSWSMAFRQ